MLKRWMPVSNVLKPVQLLRLQEQRQRQAMNGRVAPSFVVESTSGIQVAKESSVLFRTEEVQVSYLEIRPKVAEVPGITFGGA